MVQTPSLPSSSPLAILVKKGEKILKGSVAIGGGEASTCFCLLLLLLSFKALVLCF